MRLHLAACAILALTACARQPTRQPAIIRDAPLPWSAVSYSAEGTEAYLGNPSFGIRLLSNGTGDERSFLIYKGALARVPNLAQLGITFPSAATPTKFRTELDFREGTFSAKWGGRGESVAIETAVDPRLPLVAQRIVVSSDAGATIVVPNQNGAVNLEFVEASEPLKPASAGKIESRWSGNVALDWNNGSASRTLALPAGVFVLQRVAALQMPGAATNLVGETFQSVRRRSAAYLASKFKTDIEIAGPMEDQQAVRSFLFYLYTTSGAKLPPFATSNDKYKGHRFWDAEAWILPVLALINPGAASDATKWRLDNFDRRYVWETGLAGKDFTGPEFSKAVHVAGWVAWWANRAQVLLKDINERVAKKLTARALAQFKSCATKTPRGIEFLQVESPDEGRLRNNDLVTNLLAKETARVARDEDKKWANSIVIPKGPDGLPETYENDPQIRYQQTSALLSLYPLEWSFPKEVQTRMFDRYKDKVTDVGPSMSDSVHSVIAARLKRPEEAYRFWKKSWKEFLDPARMVFRERRRGDDGYFVTGAAGCLQAVIYGFLGVRIGTRAVPGAPSVELRNGYFLSVEPTLPKAWKSVTFRNLRAAGKIYTIRATHSSVSIEKGGQ